MGPSKRGGAWHRPLRLAGALVVALAGACSSIEEPPPLEPRLREALETWLDANGRPPADLVVDLFRDHDVVFLGEQHRIRHDLLFVQSLLAPLHAAGVHVLATEFGRRVDQPLVDSLLAAPEWDEALARRIVFQQFTPWGFQEYVDVYRAAWELDRSLPPGEQPFRILAMNDSLDFSHVRTPADQDDPAVKKKIWSGQGEHLWAPVILEQVELGRKVLVHCGLHHAFTAYRQPIVSEGRFVRFDSTKRAGNHVFDAIGKRAVTVFLHAPWNAAGGYSAPFVHPADGVIDALMLERPGGPVPVGFRLAGSPFGALAPRTSVYHHGYEDFRLQDLCDAWIYTKPVSAFEGVTPIADWITESNLEQARSQVPNPAYRTYTVRQFNDAVASDAKMWERQARRLR
jgi:hypothetical protein